MSELDQVKAGIILVLIVGFIIGFISGYFTGKIKGINEVIKRLEENND